MDTEFSLLFRLLLGGALEGTLSRLLTRTNAGREFLGATEGKVIALSAPPLIDVLYLLPTPGGLQLQTEFRDTPDLTLSGTPLAFAKLGARGIRRRDLFSGEIRLDGDLRIAESLQRLLQDGDRQWLEVIGNLTSPFIAGRLSDFAQAVRDWGSSAGLSLQQDLGEFLREEARETPSTSEAEAFLAAVDRLRDDCERLEARIARLQQLPAEGPQGPDRPAR